MTCIACDGGARLYGSKLAADRAASEIKKATAADKSRSWRCRAKRPGRLGWHVLVYDKFGPGEILWGFE